MYKHNYVELVGFFIVIICAVVGTIHKRKVFNSYKLAIVLMFIGISSVTLSCIINSLSANRWDNDFIIAFLLLKEINGLGWLVRGPAHIGYILFAWGGTVLLVAISSKRRR